MEGHANSGIIYVFDSLRFDAIGSHDSSFSTPTIDSLIEDGFSFQDAWAQATWTYASSASIFSGLYPTSHNCHQYGDGLTEDMPHIADDTAESALTTACFSAAFGVSPERGYEQEFDDFFHFGIGETGLRPNSIDNLHEKLQSWLSEHRDDRTLAVVWVMVTHHPFIPPDSVDDPDQPVGNEPEIPGTQAWMRKLPSEEVDDVKDRYREVVSYSDSKLGEAIEQLKEDGLYDKTEIVVTGDHGEIFGEHARMEFTNPTLKSILSKAIPSSTLRHFGLFKESAFIGHQAIYPFNELIHVPLIYKPASQRWEDAEINANARIELIDLLPTIRRSLGLGIPNSIDGKDIVKLANNTGGKRYTFSTTQVHHGPLVFHSLKDYKHKYVEKCLVWDNIRKDFMMRAVQSLANYYIGKSSVLLDQNDELLSNSNKSAELAGVMEDYRHGCDSQSFENESVEVDDEVEEHLADLGYQ